MDPLPQELVNFCDANTLCVDQLEMLRVLKEQPDKVWDADELARAVQATPKVVASHIAAMHGRGLLTSMGEKSHACRFGPAPELEGIIERLLQLYQERPVSMLRLVYDRAAIRLRVFADAFRINEDKKR